MYLSTIWNIEENPDRLELFNRHSLNSLTVSGIYTLAVLVFNKKIL